MTIEEKAKETIPDAFDNEEIFPVREGFIVNQQRLCFKAGAEWMLEKACEYLRSQYPVHYQEWYELANERVKQFKKAMEE
nr:MAG TPA: hypothetical protein [Caudoviricetes sp.]